MIRTRKPRNLAHVSVGNIICSGVPSISFRGEDRHRPTARVNTGTTSSLNSRTSTRQREREREDDSRGHFSRSLSRKRYPFYARARSSDIRREWDAPKARKRRTSDNFRANRHRGCFALIKLCSRLFYPFSHVDVRRFAAWPPARYTRIYIIIMHVGFRD